MFRLVWALPNLALGWHGRSLTLSRTGGLTSESSLSPSGVVGAVVPGALSVAVDGRMELVAPSAVCAPPFVLAPSGRQHQPGDPDADQHDRDRMVAHGQHQVAAELAAAGLLHGGDRLVDHCAGREPSLESVDCGVEPGPGLREVALDACRCLPASVLITTALAHECRPPGRDSVELPGQRHSPGSRS